MFRSFTVFSVLVRAQSDEEFEYVDDDEYADRLRDEQNFIVGDYYDSDNEEDYYDDVDREAARARRDPHYRAKSKRGLSDPSKDPLAKKKRKIVAPPVDDGKTQTIGKAILGGLSSFGSSAAAGSSAAGGSGPSALSTAAADEFMQNLLKDISANPTGGQAGMPSDALGARLASSTVQKIAPKKALQTPEDIALFQASSRLPEIAAEQVVPAHGIRAGPGSSGKQAEPKARSRQATLDQRHSQQHVQPPKLVVPPKPLDPYAALPPAPPPSVALPPSLSALHDVSGIEDDPNDLSDELIAKVADEVADHHQYQQQQQQQQQQKQQQQQAPHELQSRSPSYTYSPPPTMSPPARPAVTAPLSTASAVPRMKAPELSGSGGSAGDWFAKQSAGAGTASAAVFEKYSADRGSMDLIPKTLVADNSTVQFYYIDAVEDPMNAPGTVFLFGKVWIPASKSHESICVRVNNIERCVLVPLQPSVVFPEGIQDCHAELLELTQAQRIGKFRLKAVRRRYAFEEPGVPRDEANWIKVKYSFEDPVLAIPRTSRNFCGGICFGARTSALEHFVMKRDLIGPSWISIPTSGLKEPAVRASWCKYEMVVDSPKFVHAIKNNVGCPPLRVLSLSMKTVQNEAKQQQQELVMVSGILVPEVRIDGPPTSNWEQTCASFTCVRKVDADTPFPVDLQTAAAKKGQKIDVVANEMGLLSLVVAKIHLLDPDVVVGHDLYGLDLSVLLHRIRVLKTGQWSRISRLNRKEIPSKGVADRQALAGRLVVDIKTSCREHLMREKSFALTNLALSQLGITRQEIEPSLGVYKQFFAKSDFLLHFARHCENDAFLCLKLMFKLSLLPLTRELTCLAGNVWNRTLHGGRAERIEYLLLHEFHSRKYVVPDKKDLVRHPLPTPAGKKTAGKTGNAPAKKGPVHDADEEFEEDHTAADAARGGEAMPGHGSEEDDDADDGDADERRPGQSGRRRPAYAGGLVLEPKRGLYDRFVLLLDFNSLYPSIIREYNICFTTVVRPLRGETLASRGMDRIPLPTETGAGDGGSHGAVLPTVIKRLVEQRREVKNLVKNTPAADVTTLEQLDIRQKAIKLTANSMYGCLGFGNSRFYAQAMAELITSQGRETLQSSVDLVQQKLQLEVIYGDTDSIMIHTGTAVLDDAKRIADQVKREINKRYRFLEIDLDGVFKTMLLLRKKKYACLRVVSTGGSDFVLKQEMKGLDMVRRDWCGLSSDTSKVVLEKILSAGDSSREDVVDYIHGYLRDVAEQCRRNQIPLRSFIITKSLTRSLEDYGDAGQKQPHVMVGYRMKTMLGSNVQVGDRIEYVMCTTSGGGDVASSLQKKPVAGGSLAERAYHPDEVMKSNGALQIDVEWYLSQQVHPPIARLVEHVQGTDSALIAECLGLDANKYGRALHHAAGGGAGGAGEDSELAVTALASFDITNRWREFSAPLMVDCAHCGAQYAFEGVQVYLKDRIARGDVSSQNLFSCVKCRQGLGVGLLLGLLERSMRQYIARHYLGVFKCEDKACGHESRICPLLMMSVGTASGSNEPMCPVPGCRQPMRCMYPARSLYAQLRYWESLFSVEEAQRLIVEQTMAEKKLKRQDVLLVGLSLPEAEQEACRQAHLLIGTYLSHSSHHHVSLTTLFSFQQQQQQHQQHQPPALSTVS